MATTASNSNPPSSSTTGAAAAAAVAAGSIYPRSPSIARTASPPWTQIVRGPESEAGSAPSSDNQAENVDNGNAGSKKPAAWNKKPQPPPSASNGALESGGSGGGGPPVMGAELWPPLSESTKISPKLSSLSDSSAKNLPDLGSTLSPQVPGADSLLSSLPSPAQSSSSTSQKPTTSHPNHNSASNHGRPTKQKSMRRDGGVNAHANGGFPHSSEGSQYQQNHNSLKSNIGDNFQNHRDSGHRNDNPQPRNSVRKGNGGPHQNYGGRRSDVERGNHDYNHQRSFNGRDASVQPRSFVRPPLVAAPFVHPQHMQHFISPVPPDMSHYMYLHPGMPYIPPVPPVFYAAPDPAPDPALYAKIVGQIDYYFSNENLVRDTFLRQKMDEQGWVSVDEIAKFKKVIELNVSKEQILDAVRSSTVVEVQADKIRKRDDWMRWIMPPAVQFTSVSGSQSPKVPTVATVAAHIQNVTLDVNTNDLYNGKDQSHVSASTLPQSVSGDLINPSKTIRDETSSSGC